MTPRTLRLAVLTLALLAPAALASVPRRTSEPDLAKTSLAAAGNPTFDSPFALFDGQELGRELVARTASPAPSAQSLLGPALASIDLVAEPRPQGLRLHLAEPLVLPNPPPASAEALRESETRIWVFEVLGETFIGTSSGASVSLHPVCSRLPCGTASGLGNWLSEDPLLDLDSPNLYAFVAARPHESTDALGLCPGCGPTFALQLNPVASGRATREAVTEAGRRVWSGPWGNQEEHWAANKQLRSRIGREPEPSLLSNWLDALTAGWYSEANRNALADVDQLVAPYLPTDEAEEEEARWNLMTLPAGGVLRGPKVTGVTRGGIPRVGPAWRARYGPASIREHHLVPQALLEKPAFTTRLSALGVKDAKEFIDRRIALIPNDLHQKLHAEGWNEAWLKWLDETPSFTLGDVEAQIQMLTRKYELPSNSRGFARPYGKN